MKFYINNIISAGLSLALLAGCATMQHPHSCALPARPGVPEYLCKHCNCIMQVADDEWDKPCHVCHCHKTFKACRR